MRVRVCVCVCVFFLHIFTFTTPRGFLNFLHFYIDRPGTQSFG
jgi:hypothetical protein